MKDPVKERSNEDEGDLESSTASTNNSSTVNFFDADGPEWLQQVTTVAIRILVKSGFATE